MLPELDVGDYYDNAEVLAAADRKVMGGAVSEAAWIIDVLRSHIRKNPDPKSMRWLMPIIEKMAEKVECVPNKKT